MLGPALLFLFCAACAAASDYEPGYDSNSAVTLSAKTMYVSHSIVNSTHINMAVKVSLNAGQYAGVGFSENSNTMPNTDAIIAVQSTGAAPCAVNAYRIPQDTYDASFASSPKAAPYLVKSSCTFSNGVLTLKFMRLLDTKVSGDTVINLAAGSTNMIFAVGNVGQYGLVDHKKEKGHKLLLISSNPGSSAPSLELSETAATFISIFPIFTMFLYVVGAVVVNYCGSEKTSVFGRRGVAGSTVGENLFFVVWVLSWGVYYGVLVSSKAYTDVVITGKATSVSFFFLLFPLSRLKVWVTLFNLPWDRAVPFHIAFAWAMFPVMIAHLVLVVNKYGSQIVVSAKEVGESVPVLGFIAFLLVLITGVALQLIRRGYWDVFYYLHKYGLIIAVVLLFFHTKFNLILICPVAFYFLDLIYRYGQSMKKVPIDFVGATADYTTLKLTAASFDFKAFQPGSYALICIPNIDPSWHPFSIASPPGSKTVTFHIKAMAKGSWTQRLHDIARNENKSKNLKVFMYGPYGSLTVKLDQSVNIVMFAGGIGITPFLSIFAHFYDGKTNQQYKKLKTVTLIWTTKGETDLVEGVKKICASDSSFKLVTYCTAGSKGTKRPAFPTVFDQHLAGFDSGASTAVLACGPPTMVEDVEKEAARRAYAFHKESFLL